MKIRPEDADIGHWWAPCCWEDLRQIESTADLEEMREWIADEAPFAGAWTTRQSALEEMATWKMDDVSRARLEAL